MNNPVKYNDPSGHIPGNAGKDICLDGEQCFDPETGDSISETITLVELNTEDNRRKRLEELGRRIANAIESRHPERAINEVIQYAINEFNMSKYLKYITGGVSFDPNMPENTYGQTDSSNIENGVVSVTIGPSALSSPGMLLTTLEHEIIVHVWTQLYLTCVYDCELGGLINEIEAYEWNESMADHWFLTTDERMIISNKLNSLNKTLDMFDGLGLYDPETNTIYPDVKCPKRQFPRP